ncbi:MAG: NifB/NifX family molybdenum-iron cluster-binding protein [Prolixibacteraceae bacterium]|jgi:predicted Fe-Mo cluster-binding NifX family protein|nr:NifB/NifX family molybdenum-iron cluster-binding protein [Prolixibacteraceae bacterium]
MKVAITATGNSPEAKLDSRFGRCSYFALYDTAKTQIEDFHLNPNKDSEGGAGPASAQFVASLGANKIVSGEFGGKVKSIFESLDIETVVFHDTDKTIAEVIIFLNF